MLDVNLIMAAVAELMGTFILLLIGTAIATAVIPNREMAGQGDDPIAIAMWSGLALTGIVSALGRVNGRAGNPVRAFGPRVVSRTWDTFLIYLIGPVVGGVIDAIVYVRFVGQASLLVMAVSGERAADALCRTGLRSRQRRPNRLLGADHAAARRSRGPTGRCVARPGVDAIASRAGGSQPEPRRS